MSDTFWVLSWLGWWGAGYMTVLILMDLEGWDYVKAVAWFVIFPWVFVSSFWSRDDA